MNIGEENAEQAINKPVVIFINCYEEMATGMRILAQIALDEGYDVRIYVLHGYNFIKSTKKLSKPTIIISGELQESDYTQRPISAEEISLLQQEIKALKPTMLCVSSRSTYNTFMHELLPAIRDTAPEATMVCGGYGPTFDPEFYLKHGANLVLRGEGEIAMREVLRLHRMGLSFESVPNACYTKDGIMVSNPLQPPLRDLSSVPLPLAGDDRVAFIDNNILERRDPAYNDKNYRILTGRGCVAQCSYCTAPALSRKYKAEGHSMPRYRRRPPEQVLRELENAKEKGIQYINFFDEFLVASSKELLNFFTEYGKRIHLPFSAHFRHEQFLHNKELTKTVIDAGLDSLVIGFQAGNEAMARTVYNRHHNFADLLAYSKIMYNNRIKLNFHFISGTSLNTDAEFTDKCALARTLPYNAAFPYYTRIWDFKYGPALLSKMATELEAGKFKLLSIDEWAEKALIVHLHHVAPSESMIQEVLANLPAEGRVEYLANAYTQTVAARQKWELQKLAENLAGKDIFVLGEDTQAYAQSKHLFSASRIRAQVALPWVAEDEAKKTGHLTLEQAKQQDVPLVIFGDKMWLPSQVLRKYGKPNTLFCVSQAQAVTAVQSDKTSTPNVSLTTPAVKTNNTAPASTSAQHAMTPQMDMDRLVGELTKVSKEHQAHIQAVSGILNTTQQTIHKCRTILESVVLDNVLLREYAIEERFQWRKHPLSSLWKALKASRHPLPESPLFEQEMAKYTSPYTMASDTISKLQKEIRELPAIPMPKITKQETPQHNTLSGIHGIADKNAIILNENTINTYAFTKKRHAIALKATYLDLFLRNGGVRLHDMKLIANLLCYAFILQNIPAGARLLEVGGGNSRILKALARDYECWNIDAYDGVGTGPTVIPENAPYKIVLGYMGDNNKELPDKYFDCVFSISVMEHLPKNAAAVDAVHKDIARVLKSGGYSFHSVDARAPSKPISVLFLQNLKTPYLQLFGDHSLYSSIEQTDDLWVLPEEEYNAIFKVFNKVSWKEFLEKERFAKPCLVNALWKKHDAHSATS